MDSRPRSCRWCGRPIALEPTGRPRLYCRRSCRQRAYEQRVAVSGRGLPADAVVLTADEAAAVADRAFLARAAAEDVATALAEGADHAELAELSAAAVAAARAAERLR